MGVRSTSGAPEGVVAAEAPQTEKISWGEKNGGEKESFGEERIGEA